jgi:hypothetical protein
MGVFPGHGIEFGLGGVGAQGKQVVEAILMPVDDPGEDVWRDRPALDIIELGGSISDAIVAQCWAPASDPAKRAFFLLRVIGLIATRRSWRNGEII